MAAVHRREIGAYFVFGGLTYFPAANSEEEGNDIRLLLLLKLFDVLEGTHLGCLVVVVSARSKASYVDQERNVSVKKRTRLEIVACKIGWSCVVFGCSQVGREVGGFLEKKAYQFLNGAHKLGCG